MFFSFILKNCVIVVLLLLFILLLIVFEIYNYFNSKIIISIEEVLFLINNNKATLIDLRDITAFRSCHISNSINIPLSKLNKNLSLLLPYKKKTVILMHDSNYDIKCFLKHLDKNQYLNVKYFKDGLEQWKEKGYPVIFKS